MWHNGILYRYYALINKSKPLKCERSIIDKLPMVYMASVHVFSDSTSEFYSHIVTLMKPVDPK